MTKFSFNRSVLESRNVVCHLEAAGIKFYSPSNELCVWKTLAAYAYKDSNNPTACEESENQAKLVTVEDSKGHSLE
jgi:hypothetical protein